MNLKTLFAESDNSVETLLIQLVGLFMVLSGILLEINSFIGINFDNNTYYGLFFVVTAVIVQIFHNPLGLKRRSYIIQISGIVLLVTGIISCLIPGVIPNCSIIVGLILCACGIIQFGQFFSSDSKINRKLIPGILIVVTGGLSIILGIISLMDMPSLILGFTMIVYGISLVLLSWSNRLIHKKGSYLIDALLLLSIYLIMLSVLLIPAKLLHLPFSPGGELGLLLFIFAVQMITSGETPVGLYKRSKVMVIIGFIFAIIAIITCTVPDMIEGITRILIGIMLITGGIIGITERLIQIVQKTISSDRRILFVRTVVNFMAIIIGVNMLSNMLCVEPLPWQISTIVLSILGIGIMIVAYSIKHKEPLQF